LAEELARREEERLARVLDRIRGKIVSELRPRDVAYQILDGLHQLVDYDHSSAFLTYEAAASVLRIEAEKIVWTKAKSGFVGHEIAVTPEQVAVLSGAPAVRRFGVAAGEGEDAVFQEVLDYSRGHAIPPVQSVLSAPLFFAGEFLGLLKVAAWKRRPFDRADLAVVERFLPSAAVSMRNAQVRRSPSRCVPTCSATRSTARRSTRTSRSSSTTPASASASSRTCCALRAPAGRETDRST
jgi:GAF domain-containing protein